MYPSVRNTELSRDRVKFVIEEMIGRFNETAIGRQIVRPVVLGKDDIRSGETGFVSFGFNHIVDKIWFVDGSFDGTSYGYQGLGDDYGKGIAEAETKYIMERIFETCGSNKLVFEGVILPSDIFRALELLRKSNVHANILLANVREHLQFWQYPNLIAKGRLRVPRQLSGYDYDIPIEFFRGLPDGTMLVANSYELGELLIKQSIIDTARISNIDPSEYEEILRDIPGLALEQLPEKVRIFVAETIKVSITNPNAVVILQCKDQHLPEVKII